MYIYIYIYRLKRSRGRAALVPVMPKGCSREFTTLTPAVTEVLGSGHNEDSYVRHGLYISGHGRPGWQTTFAAAPIIFLMLVSLLISNLRPYSK